MVERKERIISEGPAKVEQTPGGLKPEKELYTEDGYRWSIYPSTQTCLPLVCLENRKTKTVVSTTFVKGVRLASIRAWSGARHSRAPGQSWEIMHEMAARRVDADEKVGRIFVGYGHSSVGDMAVIFAHIERVPMHLCMSIFNLLSTNSGQEKSTRYQADFGKVPLQNIESYLTKALSVEERLNPERLNLERRYSELGELSLTLFEKNRKKVEARFDQLFKPQSLQERKSLISRSLDTARAFLLLGQLTGQFVGDTARNWSRLIGELKASPVIYYNSVAEDLGRLFAPKPEEEEFLGYQAEAPSLIRHTEAAKTTNENLKNLRDYLLGTDLLKVVGLDREFKGEVKQGVEIISEEFSIADRMVAQYIISLWPGLNEEGTLKWVKTRPLGVKREIAEIIRGDHNHHDEFSHLARTSSLSLIFRGSLAEIRDLNRHRAWGRFIELPLVFGLPFTSETMRQILAKGFVLPLYLTEIPRMADLKEEFRRDLRYYYKKLYEFLDFVEDVCADRIDYSFMINLLPLAHQVDLWMHGDPKQALYMPHLRVKPGGQINYAVLAWEASQLIAQSDPYLATFKIDERPDPSNREQFFSRS